jgi:hypothetical protein
MGEHDAPIMSLDIIASHAPPLEPPAQTEIEKLITA